MEVLRHQVIEGLQQAEIDVLLVLCAGLDVEVKENKKGNQKAVANAIIRYLTSETVEDLLDEGLVIFTKLDEELQTLMGIQKSNWRSLNLILQERPMGKENRRLQ